MTLTYRRQTNDRHAGDALTRSRSATMTRECSSFLWLGVFVTLMPFLLRPLGESAIRAGFYVLAAALAVSLPMVLRAGVARGQTVVKRNAGPDVVAPLVLAATIYASAVGAVRGNDLTLLAGDFFRGVILAAAIFIGRQIWRAGCEDQAIAQVWRAVVIVESIRFILFWALWIGGTYERFGGGSRLGCILATAHLLGRLVRERDAHRRIFRYLAPAIVLFNTATSLERASWLAVILTAVLLMLTGSGVAQLLRVVRRLAIALVLAFAVAAVTETSVEQAIDERLVETVNINNIDSDSSFISRRSEITSSLNGVHILPGGLRIGGGHGYEYYDPLQASEAHQIHNTYASVLVRHGLIGGIALLTALGLMMLCALHRGTRLAMPVISVCIVVSMVAAITTYSVIGDAALGVFMGIAIASALAPTLSASTLTRSIPDRRNIRPYPSLNVAVPSIP